MKAAPTLDGRLRIDLENEIDVAVMASVVGDAGPTTATLAEAVSGGMDAEVAEDWDEFVVPDLRESFNNQVACVAKALAGVEPGSTVFVPRDEAEQWYGALNQARLALESRYQFGDDELEKMDPERRTARIRSHFYQVLQGLLLDFLMRGPSGG